MCGPGDHLRQMRRVDQKFTRGDGSAAACSGRHGCNLSRVAVEQARHDAIVAVVVGGLLLRPINEPIVTIGAWRFRLAAFNFLNHGQNSFATGYVEPTNLSLNGSNIHNAAYSPSSGFGFAPYKLGRRLLEVSAQFSF
jgi:hypothetical protein